MPDGATNAFATKMLYHFQHLRSPIQCVETYPTENYNYNDLNSIISMRRLRTCMKIGSF